MKLAFDLDQVRNLVCICNSCGKVMRNMGEWPVRYPKEKDNSNSNTVQCIRYSCTTCKVPSDTFNPGYPVMFTILGEEK